MLPVTASEGIQDSEVTLLSYRMLTMVGPDAAGAGQRCGCLLQAGGVA